ncbi:hypothetical protein TNCV_1023671 [Trichonephila clavipes]|nr:hypothetical protein TNCV_1023671 [Trichonephila clavipes]
MGVECWSYSLHRFNDSAAETTKTGHNSKRNRSDDSFTLLFQTGGRMFSDEHQQEDFMLTGFFCEPCDRAEHILQCFAYHFLPMPQSLSPGKCLLFQDGKAPAYMAGFVQTQLHEHDVKGEHITWCPPVTS